MPLGHTLTISIKEKENTCTYGRGRQGPLSQLHSFKISQFIKMEKKGDKLM